MTTAPVRWTTRTLDVPGARLHLEVSGPAGGDDDEATPLALVGHPTGTGGFRDLVEHLSDDRTVLLHDPRGFGASPLDDPTDDADPDRLADDLVALLDAAVPGRRVDVFGSSGGAVTALALAARHPERVRVAAPSASWRSSTSRACGPRWAPSWRSPAPERPTARTPATTPSTPRLRSRSRRWSA